ncbi:mannitol dehydrogenase family protein [Novosphingobium sp. 9]|uniref:mannitol dehydrogenase family protein n=1 Tax=Novosphingobium sp. 9 TaxID=2025349 RepID=UPI0021B55F11|nr:mannitol dehydrogenase family protein [Novosphingobium sp. 9]
MRLSQGALSALPAGVAKPGYDRAGMRAGVVHFGPGAFHRAHQAAAFDTLLGHDPRWGITGVSLHSRGVADGLNPQGGLYTLALLDAVTDYRVIGSIGQVLTGDQTAAILAALADPQTRIISATVTEKGYCLDAGGALDIRNAAILADIDAARNAPVWQPSSFPGWVVRALQARRHSGAGPITVLSCDNLTDNGRKLEGAVRSLAEAVDPELAQALPELASFPNAMVDSITPATDDALRAQVMAATGLEDAWPIQRERFSQWVIEDRFVTERPELECAGVTFAADVRPFEQAKLRLLNGAHSSLAYIGLGRGHETVADAMADAELASFVERLMREDIAPTVSPPPGLDLGHYITDVLARFANPAIRHLLSQIAWDGSQKLPYRLLGTVRDTLSAGRSVERLVLPVAAWVRFVDRAAREGRSLVDPLADTLLARAGDWRAMLALTEVFGDLGADSRFTNAVEHGLEVLERGSLS